MRRCILFLWIVVFCASCERVTPLMRPIPNALHSEAHSRTVTHLHPHAHIHTHSPEHPHIHEHEHTHETLDDLLHEFAEYVEHPHASDCPVYHAYCLDTHKDFSETDIECVAEAEASLLDVQSVLVKSLHETEQQLISKE